MKKISLLGATGSIGIQTLEVIAEHPEEFELSAMTFGSNLDAGIPAIKKFHPKFVSVRDRDIYEKLLSEFAGSGISFAHGDEGNIEAAVHGEADIVVNALLGSVGLLPTLKAIELGRTIAIANKETLVTAGHLVTEHAKKYNAVLLPVDSEHSAIYQCLQGEDPASISRLIVTASGGSFRDRAREELKDVSVEDALKHPNWSMGAKITIDSATMMNKGLEVIEAHWLFGIPYEEIDVLLHRESIIHSMVEFHDGSVKAQLGTPDMKVPIQYALTYPERMPLKSTERLNLWDYGQLHFAKADFSRYRCLQFAYESGKIGGTMPAVLNAANEVAAASFLSGEITFLEIEELIERALLNHEVQKNPDLETIQLTDAETRRYVRSLLK
ncbi:1-deoxy-D-xylulose-5-phosphate reductoisomerase [Metabacillus sp. GX 13764]|uniref:1-deoxy-D-xylulose-5-phosphate reductoisomerase n=1 Tax=Metabacillus kandeliae TaxID=2900151 RepID=UPI001E48D39F|nr:1-deoxy-D-xylulose-5-phosphate reductoisomerase [Metabacillus kandeliae]MCD7033748.1 1-deoxy-D-xylulose-5-phosphate reductoisomerase [Metabacillus kandeliae]